MVSSGPMRRAVHDPSAAPRPERVKCLLVDDLEENLLALSALLRGPDVELLTARSGPEALELLLVHDVALALMDVQMPEMDGFALAELMRGAERTRHIPIIFVTAAAHDRSRVFTGYEAGAVDFLYKPIEPHILKNKAAVFFQLYRQKQQLARELQERTETLRLNEMFTAVLGHDLRTPLAAILGSAEVLQARSPDPLVRTTATRIQTSAKRMGKLIEDVLDLSRARLAGGIPLQRNAMDLEPLVQRLVQEHRVAWPDRTIDVRIDGLLHGDWDAERLAQVLDYHFSHSLADDSYFALVVGVVDEANDALHFCQAGFPPPLLLSPDAGVVEVGEGGVPVALVPQAQFERVSVAFAPGDRLVVYSDGVVEATNRTGDQLGIQRLKDVAAARLDEGPAQLLAGLTSSLREWGGSGHFDDDISIIVMDREFQHVHD